MENNDLFDIEFDKDEDCWSVTGYYGINLFFGIPMIMSSYSIVL